LLRLLRDVRHRAARHAGCGRAVGDGERGEEGKEPVRHGARSVRAGCGANSYQAGAGAADVRSVRDRAVARGNRRGSGALCQRVRDRGAGAAVRRGGRDERRDVRRGRGCVGPYRGSRARACRGSGARGGVAARVAVRLRAVARRVRGVPRRARCTRRGAVQPRRRWRGVHTVRAGMSGRARIAAGGARGGRGVVRNRRERCGAARDARAARAPTTAARVPAPARRRRTRAHRVRRLGARRLERRVILGTAGHVDHGKTALVKALTGVDTDRLAEEKRRGITIDLGFAPLDLGEAGVLGVVDVPGHEAFVRNMLAGATGVDLVLLVVAADEGVMPQTREHLAILDLLGVRGGVIALTKCDLVDDDWLALVRDDVAALTLGTPLEGAPMVPTSVVSGRGLDVLRDTLASAVRALPARDAADLFR